ncbi:universal stress protein [candidate division GN15 bacterium]|uniref:Universal stress protein n=1 Tax=candidate division GN15 bacterium TaxID=2072418 RepID=A0A855WVD0_9BACT|nr:MAG: universal stress protein [candidate division GN15 bacterium]
MYKHILVPLENSATDEVILRHIRLLAKCLQAKVTLIHCADGFQARHQKRLGESEEMRRDREYLEQREQELRSEGFDIVAVLAWGDPAEQILAAAERGQCDLIAMSTHGHRFLSDLFYGSVSSDVRHKTRIPVLLVRA